MEDNKLWLMVWKIVGCLLAILVLSISSCVSYENKLKAELIDKGHDPIDVRCAFGGDGTQQMCIVRSVRH